MGIGWDIRWENSCLHFWLLVFVQGGAAVHLSLLAPCGCASPCCDWPFWGGFPVSVLTWAPLAPPAKLLLC